MVALGVGPDWLAQEVWYVRVLLIVLAAIVAAPTFWLRFRVCFEAARRRRRPRQPLSLPCETMCPT
jgi:hypothetical protein